MAPKAATTKPAAAAPAAATATAAPAAAAEKAAPVAKAPAERKAPEGMSLTDKITLGVQVIAAEGDNAAKEVPYGSKNNPKREGTKAAERFLTYKNGMSVKAALEAGHKPRHIKKDAAKKYIVVTPAA